MTTSDLVASLEPLTHSARARRMTELGRAARRGDHESVAHVDMLWASPHAYERTLALRTLFGSGDGERVVVALSDPSRTVRRLAASMVPRFTDDAQASRAIAAITDESARVSLMGQLRRHRRNAPIEAYLDRVLSTDPRGATIDLLPLAGPDYVERHLDSLYARGGSAFWRRLCANHAALAARWITAVINRQHGLDIRLRWQAITHFATLAKRAPDESLALVRAAIDASTEPHALQQALAVLVRRRPRETFDLLRARHESGLPTRPSGAFALVSFAPVVRSLGKHRLSYLIRHAWSALPDQKHGVRWLLALDAVDRAAVLDAFLEHGCGSWGAFLFRYVPAGDPRRETAYQRWSHAARASDGTIATTTLDWLPRDLREREARRHLTESQVLASDAERRMPYASLLGWSDAREALAPFLGHSEGEIRARANRILLSVVRHHDAAMSDALDHARARKFEQDPVRAEMIEALAALPVARFRPEHLTSVGVLVRDALDAADLSPRTAAALQSLVARLFRVDGSWGATWLATLLESRGAVSMWGLGAGLTRTDAERLSPAIESLVKRWTVRERAFAIISLAQALGIRLRAVPVLLDALETLASELPYVHTAIAALALIRAHDPRRFARLVPALLEHDPSFVLAPTVARLITQYRQDLLAPFLDGAPMTGRFATGKTAWIVDFGAGHARWTRNQQERYARRIESLLSETESRDLPTLCVGARILRHLAFADTGILVRLASDPRPALRETAVRGLAWLDAGQGVPVLLDCMGDERARFAIYALRKAFAEMSPDAVRAHLRAVPTTKVTVAKEVVRLLGDQATEEAYRDLLALDRTGQHRDVRIALLRALWPHLERAETWPVLERAVSDPDWVVASKLADIPLQRLTPATESRVAGLLATILARPEPEARTTLLARACTLPLRDVERALFGRLLAHVASGPRTEARLALRAALARMQPSEIERVASTVAATTSERARLVELVPELVSAIVPYAPPHHHAVARAVRDALAREPRVITMWMSLAARTLDARGMADALVSIAGRGQLHFDAMRTAIDVIRASLDPASFEARLRDEAAPDLRRLALEALVAMTAPERGWTAERRARLRVYRSDPALVVASAAELVLPPDEMT